MRIEREKRIQKARKDWREGARCKEKNAGGRRLCYVLSAGGDRGRRALAGNMSDPWAQLIWRQGPAAAKVSNIESKREIGDSRPEKKVSVIEKYAYSPHQTMTVAATMCWYRHTAACGRKEKTTKN